jgi:protein ECT2
MLLDPNSSIASGSTSATPSPLPCTLFLFDDRLMIVKRHSSSASGRVIAGLDEIEKLAKTGIIGGAHMKKGGLSCKGVVDITDVVATDPGGSGAVKIQCVVHGQY